MQHFGRNLLVPAMASAVALMVLRAVAYAEAVPADQAMVMLSKSQAVDTKCKFLSAAEHDELSGLVARAELSLAGRATVAIASTSLAKGRVLGQASTCTDADRAELATVMGAAKTAAALAPTPSPKETQVATTTAAPVAALNKVVPQKAAVVSKSKPVAIATPKPVAAKKPVAPKPAGLAQYAAVTAKYYLVRRCGTMNAQSITALYKNVLAIHRASLQSFGRAPVANAMHRAEATANAQSCS